jgi:hypothetical protein
MVMPPSGNLTMRQVLHTVMNVLPYEFQATVFDGRVILYRQEREYDYAREIIRGRSFV